MNGVTSRRQMLLGLTLIGMMAMTIASGCAGGANLGTLGAERSVRSNTPDSSADFAQIPAGGFGGSDTSTGATAATFTGSGESFGGFGGGVLAGDTGFDDHAMTKAEATVVSVPKAQEPTSVTAPPDALPVMGTTVGERAVGHVLNAVSLWQKLRTDAAIGERTR